MLRVVPRACEHLLTQVTSVLLQRGPGARPGSGRRRHLGFLGGWRRGGFDRSLGRFWMTLTFCRRGLVVIFDFDWRRDFHLLGLGKLKRKAMILCKLDAVSGGRPFTLHHRHKMSLFHTHQHTQDQPPTNVQTRPWMRSTNLFTTHLAGHGVLREVPRAVEVLPARAAELARFVRRGGGAPGGGGARDVARGGRRLDARCVDDVLRGDGRAQLRVCEKHASNTNKNSDMWRRVVCGFARAT